MNSRDAIQQELNELRSSLPQTNNKQPVFTVPEGYFENFAASVLAKLNSQQAISVTDELEALSPMLAAISRKTPFSVPENYFTDLATGLPALVNDEALPDILSTHTKLMPYLLPDGYFDGLAAQVVAKVKRPKAKVVSFSSRFMRIAAAAAIAGIIVVAGFFYVAGNRNPIDPAKQPAAWVAQKLKNVPKSDLEAFLQTVDTGFGSQELAQKGGKSEVRQLLQDVSTTELDAFLSELPSDTDISSIN
jgi:hypothetical protein